MVLPQATIPGARFAAVTVAALQVAWEEARSLIVTDAGLGRTGVSKLLIRSFRTDQDASASGGSWQVQHACKNPSAVSTYALTQMVPPLVPAFWTLRVESAMLRFAAYLT